MKYGCHNRAPYKEPIRMSPVCEYTKTDLGQADARCDGCKWREKKMKEKKELNHHEFGFWWFEIGSGLHPLEGEDQEQHAYRIASAAWAAAHAVKE